MKPGHLLSWYLEVTQENRVGLGNQGRGTFVSSSVMSRRVQMAGTNGGHSVDVLSSRPELITGSTRSAGAACGPSPRQGQTQRPNALGQQSEQAAKTS